MNAVAPVACGVSWTVVAVGSGKRLDSGEVQKLDVQTGDVILFGKYSGTEIMVEGEELIIVRENDIFGVIIK